MRFEGKVAVVTGGGSGIGEAICLRLASEGATLAVLDLDEGAARLTCELAGGGMAVAADVRDSASVDDAIRDVEAELGAPDVLVNNAGATGRAHLERVLERVEAQRREAADGEVRTPLDALVRLTDEEWRALLAVHLDGTFHCTRAVTPAMAARGSGAVVNVASICGLEGCAGHPHYSAAKAGILGFTRAVAKELVVQGIRVNAIAPGYVETGGADGVTANRQAVAAGTPACRQARPEEIAAAVAFLASDDASYVIGETLSPNGGLVTI
jgi:3-oxoacyl-[acyl-carrier protein] reductase